MLLYFDLTYNKIIESCCEENIYNSSQVLYWQDIYIHMHPPSVCILNVWTYPFILILMWENKN